MSFFKTHPFSVVLGASIATVALVLTSLTPPITANSAPAVVCYSFTTIDQGNYSGFGYYCDGTGGSSGGTPSNDTPPPCYADVAMPEFEAIIRNECAWIDFWTGHTDNMFPPPPPPTVDFDKYVVVAVISGTRPTGCYGIEITHIDNAGCGRTIHVRERVPCPSGELCTDALTNNFHFIKVCKEFLPFEVPVCFDHKLSAPTCNLIAACLQTDDGG
jgi:hypothetical protein